jgi:hypothetical protein
MHNIWIYSDLAEEYEIHIRAVMDMLSKYNFKYKDWKYQFGQQVTGSIRYKAKNKGI